MLRIFKSQPIGYFRDGFPFQEHLPGLFHQIMPDIPRGAFSGTGTDLVWYTAPTIINTFIEAYGFKGKTLNSESKAEIKAWAEGPALHR